MTTEKRHMYSVGTVNVETGNVVVKQDVNYYNANDQSTTKSVIRMMEDKDRYFLQNNVYDGLSLSASGSAYVIVSAGNAMVGGRWVTVDETALDFTTSGVAFYNAFIRLTPNGDTPRNPSTGETVAVVYEPASSYSASDYDLFLGKIRVSGTGVVDTIWNIGDRRYGTRFIRPYAGSTQVSVLTGTDPQYISAFDFQSSLNKSNLPLRADAGFSGTAISGSSLQITGNSYYGNQAHFSGALLVDGETHLYSQLYVTNTATFSGSSIMVGGVSMQSTLDVAGVTNIDDYLYATNNITASGSLITNTLANLTGDRVTVSNGLDVTGVTDLASAYLSGNLQVSGTSKVTGISEHTGVMYTSTDVHMSGALYVNTINDLTGGLLTLNNDSRVLGTFDVTQDANFTDIFTSQNITSSGAVTAKGSLFVTNTANFDSTVYFANGVVYYVGATGIPKFNIAADDGTYTGLVTSDSGVLKYRTTSQVLSDIGAASSGHNHNSSYYTETEMDDWLLNGSTNYQWVILVPTGADQNGHLEYESGYVVNDTGVSCYWRFDLVGFPFVLPNGKTLRVRRIWLELSDGNSSNYVNSTRHWSSYDGGTGSTLIDSGNQGTAGGGSWTFDPTDIDLGSIPYFSWGIELQTFEQSARVLKVSAVRAEIYYA